jgi:Periplasmic copper-binding protein (NosD)
MNRVLVIFACGLLSTPAYAQVREIVQAQSSRDQSATSTASIFITEPGSYRLLSNVVATGSNPAIEIRAFSVTLDLNGFLVDAQGGGAAIFATGPTGTSEIVVMNGNVHSAGDGILLQAGNCRVEHVSVDNVGRKGVGIRTGGGCTIRHNTVRASDVGISCIFCAVESNSVIVAGTAGIEATNGSLVLKNTVNSALGTGLLLDSTTGYANNVMSFNGNDVSGGVQIGGNLCATNGICP